MGGSDKMGAKISFFSYGSDDEEMGGAFSPSWKIEHGKLADRLLVVKNVEITGQSAIRA
jgi:hypothetical protein